MLTQQQLTRIAQMIVVKIAQYQHNDRENPEDDERWQSLATSYIEGVLTSFALDIILQSAGGTVDHLSANTGG